MWVGFLDQRDLPLPMPVLDAFLPPDCVLHAVEIFEPDEHLHAVLASEPRNRSFFVIANAAAEVAGHPGVERTARPTCEDIDGRNLFMMQGPLPSLRRKPEPMPTHK